MTNISDLALPPRYAPTSLIKIFPFVQQADGEDIIVGNLAMASFVVLPASAVELLIWLEAGYTVGQAQAAYLEKYGEDPDIVDFLTTMEAEGFLCPLDAEPSTSLTARPNSPPVALRYHFANFPPRLAQALFSRPILVVAGLLVGLAGAALVLQPGLWPSATVLVFETHSTLLSLSLIGLVWGTIFLHEMAHLTAARALGISSRLGIGRRMWVIVAETDMTNIWSVPRARRYLAFLAGPLLDLVSGAVVVLFLFAARQHWLNLPNLLYHFAQALLFTYFMRLLWQTFLFVRTDFYYVVVNFFNCKNLLQDTENYLATWLGRRLPWLGRTLHDQSGLPRHEQQVIRWYALVWVVGRMVALTTLFWVTLPVLVTYFFHILTVLSAGPSAGLYPFLDALVFGLFLALIDLLGLALWLRGLWLEVAKNLNPNKESN